MKKVKQPVKGTGFNFGGFPKGKGISGKGGKTTNYDGEAHKNGQCDGKVPNP